MRIVAGIVMVFILFSCNENEKPAGILPEKKMQEVLWDYLKADVLTTDGVPVDSTKFRNAENVKLQQIIFAQHHVTREEFYNSYKYYMQHPSEMTVMMDSMMAIQLRNKQAYDSSRVRLRPNLVHDSSIKSINDDAKSIQ